LAKSKTDKKKKKKAALRKRKNQAHQVASREKGFFFLDLAYDSVASGNLEKALTAVTRAEKLLPPDPALYKLMADIGERSKNIEIKVRAMEKLHEMGLLPKEYVPLLILHLYETEQFSKALKLGRPVLKALARSRGKKQMQLHQELTELLHSCEYKLHVLDLVSSASDRSQKTGTGPAPKRQAKQNPSVAGTGKMAAPIKPARSPDPPSREKPVEISVDYDLDLPAVDTILSGPEPADPAVYELALESHEIRLQESFDILVCLPSLSQVRSFWYQEETAKKVLKRFRGRALLSDEVGLGKTIEALMVLSEYKKRGMVKTALILTPTPLVSQWKEEMAVKFGLDVPSTDDPGFTSGDRTFWQAPFVLASINQAKSKKNFDLVTEKNWDLLIVDEAHHLKNKATLNWKLVNSIQKKFILLLTATPVENNLMELYNLITLLKPGQLETARSFREKFMTRGDPTDPKNKALLRELLSEVMIRNTRALAGISIPPRFAQTVRIEPSGQEAAFYERLESLITGMNARTEGHGKMLVKHLLAQAGSSPDAVASTLDNMLLNNKYPAEFHDELIAVRTLCRTSVDTTKNKALLQVIRSATEKIIVFVKYKGTVTHLAEFLEWHRISFSLFHGSMDNAAKDREIKAFQEDNQVLVTTEIGGEGRNLQFCNRMINYDLPWNPMKIEQRIGRIHRIGQEREVHIFNFCAKGSIEDHILDILDKKINMFEMVIGEIDMILGRIRGEKEFSDLVYDMWVTAGSEEERKKQFNNLGTRLKRARTGYEKTKELDETLFGDTYEL
jgi:superfamily II DNA or RNA helicase